MGKILLAARKKVGRTDKVEIKRWFPGGRAAHQPRLCALNMLLDALDTCDSVIVTMTRSLENQTIVNICYIICMYSIMFDIFIIALALRMYDHACTFVMQKLLLYFEGRVTQMTKTRIRDA